MAAVTVPSDAMSRREQLSGRLSSLRQNYRVHRPMHRRRDLQEGERVLARIGGQLREARLLQFTDPETRDRALVQFDDGSQQVVESYVLEPAPHEPEKRERFWWPESQSGRRWLVSLSVAMLGVIGTYLGIVSSRGNDGGGSIPAAITTSTQPLVTASAVQEIVECGTSLFVREKTASRLASGALPTESDWTSFYRKHNAIPAEETVVSVSVQGESARKITLTGIQFKVRRHRRPAGAVFANPCGGPITGRAVEVDVDKTPPRIVDSVADPNGTLGAHDSKPIQFPWTVSLTDPLLLYVEATTVHCYCTWRAIITWQSGSKSGRLLINNGGRGYDLIGIAGFHTYDRTTDAGGWTDGGVAREKNGRITFEPS